MLQGRGFHSINAGADFILASLRCADLRPVDGYSKAKTKTEQPREQSCAIKHSFEEMTARIVTLIIFFSKFHLVAFGIYLVQ